MVSLVSTAQMNDYREALEFYLSEYKQGEVYLNTLYSLKDLNKFWHCEREKLDAKLRGITPTRRLSEQFDFILKQFGRVEEIANECGIVRVSLVPAKMGTEALQKIVSKM